MSLNEKIKYCRKPIDNIFAGEVPKEEKRMMKCIAKLTTRCKKEFKTTKDVRICTECDKIVKYRT